MSSILSLLCQRSVAQDPFLHQELSPCTSTMCSRAQPSLCHKLWRALNDEVNLGVVTKALLKAQTMRLGRLTSSHVGHKVISMPRLGPWMTHYCLTIPRRLQCHPVACQCDCSHASSNLHDELLIDLCLAASVLLATGRVAGNANASAFFSRGTIDVIDAIDCRLDQSL